MLVKLANFTYRPMKKNFPLPFLDLQVQDNFLQRRHSSHRVQVGDTVDDRNRSLRGQQEQGGSLVGRVKRGVMVGINHTLCKDLESILYNTFTLCIELKEL